MLPLVPGSTPEGKSSSELGFSRNPGFLRCAARRGASFASQDLEWVCSRVSLVLEAVSSSFPTTISQEVIAGLATKVGVEAVERHLHGDHNEKHPHESFEGP